MITSRLRTKAIALACSLALLSSVDGAPAYAVEPQAPTLTAYEARAYRNVIETGDLMVIPRLALPAVNWDTHTADAALVSLIQDGVTYQLKAPPDTGEMLAGFYLAAGHGVVWEDAATVRVESNPTLFTNNTSSSVAVTWVSTPALVLTSTAAQTIVCNGFRALLTNVENADPTDDFDALDLVAASIVTEAGTVMAQAAFSAIVQVLPACFFVGLEPGMQAPNPGAPVLRDDLITTVEASAGWTRWVALAGAWGFAGREAELAAMFGIGFAFVWLLVMLWLSRKSINFSVTASMIVLFAIGVSIPHLLLQVAFVIVMIALMGAAGFYMRQMPR